MGLSMTTIQFPAPHLTALALAAHLAAIFADLTMPVIGLYLVLLVRRYLKRTG